MLIDVHAHWGPWFFSMDVGPIDVNIELMDRFGIDIQLVSAIEAIVCTTLPSATGRSRHSYPPTHGCAG